MKGKVALITGAGSGIGAATAQGLAERGCQVVCGDLRPEAANQVAHSLRASGAEAIALPLDVADSSSVAKFVEAAVKAYGDVHYLVNSAGIWQLTPLEDLSEEDWDRVMNVNLKGTFLCCRAVVPLMKRNGFGRIVNISSAAGRMGGSYCGPHYAASKGGVVAFTQNIARMLGPYGIAVNAVAPGPTDSPMTANWPEEVRRGVIARTPMGRFATPNDLARAIIFLLSDEASFITGETLEVNGGLFMH